jgi:hypothetical protein
MLGDRRGYSHLKEEALHRIKWRNRFGRGCGPVVWQITDDDSPLPVCTAATTVKPCVSSVADLMGMILLYNSKTLLSHECAI